MPGTRGEGLFLRPFSPTERPPPSQEYLYKQGGVDKLRSRNQGGAAQFMGVDMGGEPQGESGGNTSERRYKMHLIKFRLANASDIALAKGSKVQPVKGASKKSNLVLGPKQLVAEASHGVHNTSTTLGDFVYIRLNASSSKTTAVSHVHVNASSNQNTTNFFGTSAVPLPHTRTNTSPSRTYKTTHPTHATPVDKLLLLKAAPQAGCGRNVAGSSATTATTKATTTGATTTKRTTPSTAATTTTTTTPRPTTLPTTTRRKTSTAKTHTTHTHSTKVSTTTAAPTTCGQHTTVKAANCIPVLVPRTTAKPMLHGHPYLVIKVHEEHRDRGLSSKPHTRPETGQVHANLSQHKGKRHEWPPDESVGQADTESLKHQMEGNLLSMLRTIRELNRLANGSKRAPPPMELGPSIEIDRVLVDRSKDVRLSGFQHALDAFRRASAARRSTLEALETSKRPRR
ncbi:mucin-5AC-like [Ixodes scapularis]